MKKIIVEENFNKTAIYSLLRRKFPQLPLSALNKAFRVKDIKVNGIRVNKDHILNTNDIVEIYLPDNVIFGIPLELEYVYEDLNILIAYKPRGITSCNNKSKSDDTPYFDDLVRNDRDIKICHRLDTNTEGLVIFSKNNDIHSVLLDAFKSNKITKEYLALVYGKLPKDHDILSHYMIKDTFTGYSKILENQSKNSVKVITEYNLIKYIKEKDASLVNVKLHTGKTHQIRAHMKFIGNPLIGDSKYSTNTINKLFKLKSQVLYAYKYTFNFETSSSLSYLNDITIDISKKLLEDIYKLLSYSD